MRLGQSRVLLDSVAVFDDRGVGLAGRHKGACPFKVFFPADLRIVAASGQYDHQQQSGAIERLDSIHDPVVCASGERKSWCETSGSRRSANANAARIAGPCESVVPLSNGVAIRTSAISLRRERTASTTMKALLQYSLAVTRDSD